MAFSSISFLWSKGNIRAFIMLSLLLQVILILFAPLRKKTTDKRIVFLLWLAYLMADWVAIFGIGLISHNQGSSSAHIADVDKAFGVFWASFLLLHLGGPDTITAFSLEDSSLWRRYLLDLTFQVGAVTSVFAQIFPSDKSLLFPTMLVFLAGVIKNVERTLALNRSSLSRLREWVLSQQESLDDEVDKSRDELPDDMAKKTKGALDLLDGNSHDEEEAKLAESIVVKHAYYFFQISKLFLTDLIFTRRQRQISREYFRRVSAMDALRVISVELHFIYEVLHTKALAIRSKWSYVFRFIAFIDLAMAFIVFNRLKKHQLPELDVKITYLLLFGGIALDVIAVLMLVFSDWTVAEIQWCQTRSPKLDSFLHNLVSATDYVMKPRIPTCEAELNTKVTCAVLDTPLIFRRWSESISACNLLSESFEKSPKKMYKRHWRWGNIAFSKICGFPFYVAEKTISYSHQAVHTITRGCGMRNMDGKRSMIADTRYVSTNPFIMKLWIFIFKAVKHKSNYATFSGDLSEIKKTREIYEARGVTFLWSLPHEAHHRKLSDSDMESRDDEIPQIIKGCNVRARLMELLSRANYDESIIMWHLATEMWYNREDPVAGNDEREFSKILSDYMMYLLLNQANVVSAVAGIAQMRSATILGKLQDHIDTKDVKSLCKAMFARNVEEYRPSRAIPLLDRAIILAREIEKLGEWKWKVMSRVWVGMLTYAAGHIKGEAHAQVLSRGGELLAFVWLLMVHLGIVYRPEWAPRYIFREEEESRPTIDRRGPSEMDFP